MLELEQLEDRLFLASLLPYHRPTSPDSGIGSGSSSSTANFRDVYHDHNDGNDEDGEAREARLR